MSIYKDFDEEDVSYKEDYLLYNLFRATSIDGEVYLGYPLEYEKFNIQYTDKIIDIKDGTLKKFVTKDSKGKPVFDGDKGYMMTADGAAKLDVEVVWSEEMSGFYLYSPNTKKNYLLKCTIFFVGKN